ncbi:hypothetical protein LTR08_008581 [Meristemomyces frigidus]|nr:hypothetical protein LTR08_008581 [Meristemomyces frigidus]
MPRGFERLNERTKRPNDNINFIKPLAGADAAVAKDFLERIAAQCYPVMKENRISVMSLAEHAPNSEFLGRNFNAGEVIELVLKDKGGRWLSFKFVQMVMMHELAHCKQMNHSRSFWDVRNGYAKLMEGLWERNYVGEGMWGRGRDLVRGVFVHESMPVDAQIPEHLCGGTYRRARGKKRKRGQEDVGGGEKVKVTYAERQQKRIAKKFGKHGEGSALLGDELIRGALDGKSGKRHAGKPRVAKSKRGRDLRANAALARLEAQSTKQATPERTPELENDQGTETESGWSSDDDLDSSESIILRKKGGAIKDHDGHDLVRVCGDEGEEADGGGNEMDELRVLNGRSTNFPEKLIMKPKINEQAREAKKESWPQESDDGSETESEAELPLVNATNPSLSKDVANDSETESEVDESPNQPETKLTKSSAKPSKNGSTTNNRLSIDPPPPPEANTAPPALTPSNTNPAEPAANPMQAPVPGVCIICSLENSPDSSTCLACSHVLRPSLMKNHWRCTSAACSESAYINAGDVGRCGVCGGKQPARVAGAAGAKSMGVLSADVLRWD